jgi:hypothetical protein
MLYLYVEAVIFKIWKYTPHKQECLSQIQNKFKAAACNVCIKGINISNIGGRVHLKVTFIQQNTEHTVQKGTCRDQSP